MQREVNTVVKNDGSTPDEGRGMIMAMPWEANTGEALWGAVALAARPYRALAYGTVETESAPIRPSLAYDDDDDENVDVVDDDDDEDDDDDFDNDFDDLDDDYEPDDDDDDLEDDVDD